MRKNLLLLGGLVPSLASAQTLAKVDPVVADQFSRAFAAGDEATISRLLSDKVQVNVTKQLGPDGSVANDLQGTGRDYALAEYRKVIASVGQPVDEQCFQPDAVSQVCQFKFDQPGHGLMTMIMFDGSKIGGLMVKYGGAAAK